MSGATSMALDSTRFRSVLGHLPTGVTVISGYADGEPTGMAANSVTSVSLDPPLILFCPAKSSSTWPTIRTSGRFCVNVLAGHHGPLTRQFAAKQADRFAGVSFAERPCGPVLLEATAWLECEIEHEHDAGDHTIVVGRVLAMDATPEVEPLVFFRGGYGSFRGA